MKQLLPPLIALLVAVIYFGVTLLLCFVQGYIVHGTSHVLAWHSHTVNTLFWSPLVMGVTGLCVYYNKPKNEPKKEGKN